MKQFSQKQTATAAGRRQTERRASPRHLLTAAAEVADFVSGTRMRTRTMDVSRGGCFIDTLQPLPVRSRVRVFLFKGGSSLHADGMVTYCQSGLGMGVVFTNVIPEHRPVLEGWLAEAHRERPADLGLLPKYPKQEEMESLEQERAAFRKLIHLLAARGVLTEADTASLLHDSIL